MKSSEQLKMQQPRCALKIPLTIVKNFTFLTTVIISVVIIMNNIQASDLFQ